MATFGERLKESRLEKNITLEKMAEDLETTKATLSRYENNKREPKIEFARKAAKYLNISYNYLLGKINEPAPYDNTETTDEIDSENLTEEFVKLLKKYKWIEKDTELTPEKAISFLNKIFNEEKGSN